MKKRILAMFLAAVMGLALTPTAFAALPTSGTCGDDIIWAFDAGSGTLTISGSGAMDDYNFNWGSNPTPWADFNDQITAVAVSEGITHIGDEAFGSTWYGGALQNLKMAVLPSTLTSIGEYSFANSNLTSIDLPMALNTIGTGAFEGTLLTTVNIPASVTSIGYSRHWKEETASFDDIYTLKAFTVDAGNANYSAVDGILYNKDVTRLAEYPLGKADENYTIPKTISAPLYLHDFWGIPALKSITVPKEVNLMYDPDYVGPDGGYIDDSWKFVLYFAGEIPADIDEWYYYSADEGIVDVEARQYEGAGTAKIIGLSPATGTKDFDITTEEEVVFFIKFDRPIASTHSQVYVANVDPLAPGAFAIYRASDDQLVYTPSQYASFDYIISMDGTQLGVHPVNIRAILDPGTEYYITMGADFVTFDNGVASPSIKKGEWTFTTAGTASGEVTINTGVFTDLLADAYYTNAITWAVENNVTQGTSATTFSPNADCTRSQIVTFLWRANGEPEPTTANNPFTDIKPSDFYYKAVLWAVEKGITQGTGATTFGPNDPCTRSQAVTFIWRANNKPVVSGDTGFSDVPAGEWYSDAVKWAVSNDITTGKTAGTFAPGDTCSRAQIVTFLYRDAAK